MYHNISNIYHNIPKYTIIYHNIPQYTLIYHNIQKKTVPRPPWDRSQDLFGTGYESSSGPVLSPFVPYLLGIIQLSHDIGRGAVAAAGFF